MSAAPLFYRLRGPEWRAAGLPCPTTAYELHRIGKLTLVKDAAGRTGITADEARRFFADAQPLSHGNKRDTTPAVAGQKRRKAA
jgi:hypothetical protein